MAPAPEASVGDGAGQVLRAWPRPANCRRQSEVAALLGTTQQHLSQIENGRRPLSLEQRRLVVCEPGIPPENLGLAAAMDPAASGRGHTLDSEEPDIHSGGRKTSPSSNLATAHSVQATVSWSSLATSAMA